MWMRGSGGGEMIFDSLHFRNGNSVTAGGGLMISPRFGDTIQTRVILEVRMGKRKSITTKKSHHD